MIWKIRGAELDLAAKIAVLGIVNVTPDSFSDGGKFFAMPAAREHADRLIAEGADVLDIGGESTRPGAQAVSVEEEIRRVVPLIEAVRRQSAIPISVDTRRAAVARAAIEAGANIINDVSALSDPPMAELAAATGAGVVLMHMQGTPETMQQAPRYSDVLAEVTDFLTARAAFAQSAGIARESIVIDPGIGFGKNLEHNLTLLGRLDRLTETGFPVLVGPSRKAFIGALTGAGAAARLPGTLAAVSLSVALGARLVRVHDVAAAVQAIQVATAIKQAGG